jgi:hypothetical protein
MSTGLFAVSCPECGGKLLVDSSGTGICTPCDLIYLNRFGHLIRIEPQPAAFKPLGHDERA